jgi:hypothetical protein
LGRRAGSAGRGADRPVHQHLRPGPAAPWTLGAQQVSEARRLAGQLLRSWYIGAFLVPKLPEAAWRLFLTRRYEQTAKRDVGNDPVRGLALYRANFCAGGNRPSGRRVGLPVQVVVPVKDPFLTPDLVNGLESWVEDLTVIRVNSGHWWPATRPAEFAEVLRGSHIRG